MSGRLVYYETNSVQEVVGGSQASNPMEAMYQGYADAYDLVDDQAAIDALSSRRLELRPEVNGYFRDNISSGYELRLTANITDNWRLQLNAAKTDRIVSNSFSKAVAFLGLTEGAGGLVVQGATEAGDIVDPEDPENTIQGYTIDRSAYTPDGAISKYLDLANTLPEGRTIDTEGISAAIFDVAYAINDRREQDEKRWGLRPYRFNVFTTYDFKEGALKGWYIGGGYRWNEANIIGEENGVEFAGRAESVADLLLRYRTSRSKGGFLGGGRWTFQLNINNVLDNTDIVPSRLAIDGNIEYMIPGGRGIAYARFDLPTPRDYRLTATYDF